MQIKSCLSKLHNYNSYYITVWSKCLYTLYVGLACLFFGYLSYNLKDNIFLNNKTYQKNFGVLEYSYLFLIKVANLELSQEIKNTVYKQQNLLDKIQ